MSTPPLVSVLLIGAGAAALFAIVAHLYAPKRRRCPRCQQRTKRLETMCYLCTHGGDECLQMVREDLEAYGVDMSATPPMMYNDALRYLVSKLGLKAGFTDTREIADYVRAGALPQPPQPEKGKR